MILYYSLHINRVFSRYTLTEIQIMTSSNVSTFFIFFVCHDFCFVWFPLSFKSSFIIELQCCYDTSNHRWIRHASKITTKENTYSVRNILILNWIKQIYNLLTRTTYTSINIWNIDQNESIWIDPNFLLFKYCTILSAITWYER